MANFVLLKDSLTFDSSFYQVCERKNEYQRNEIYSQFKNLLSFKKIKNTCRGVLFLVKLQVLHNTPPEVFLTFLNHMFKKETLWTMHSSIAIIEQKIHCVKYARIRVFSNPYFPV